jgi:hypothetical protein
MMPFMKNHSVTDFSLQKNAAFLEDMAFHADYAYDDYEMEQMGVDHGDPGDMEMEEAEVATSSR